MEPTVSLLFTVVNCQFTVFFHSGFHLLLGHGKGIRHRQVDGALLSLLPILVSLGHHARAREDAPEVSMLPVDPRRQTYCRYPDRVRIRNLRSPL